MNRHHARKKHLHIGVSLSAEESTDLCSGMEAGTLEQRISAILAKTMDLSRFEVSLIVGIRSGTPSKKLYGRPPTTQEILRRTLEVGVSFETDGKGITQFSKLVKKNLGSKPTGGKLGRHIERSVAIRDARQVLKFSVLQGLSYPLGHPTWSDARRPTFEDIQHMVVEEELDSWKITEQANRGRPYGKLMDAVWKAHQTGRGNKIMTEEHLQLAVQDALVLEGGDVSKMSTNTDGRVCRSGGKTE
jgi:hypothetical protein